MLNSEIYVEKSQNKIMQFAIIFWKCNDREFKYRKPFTDEDLVKMQFQEYGAGWMV